MELIVSIGERLREERERLGRSQTDLAETAAQAGMRGSTRQSQSLYEKGERAPDAGYLAAVASVGVDVQYVITGARDYVPPDPLKSDEVELLRHYREALPAVRKAAMGALLGAARERDSTDTVMTFHGRVGSVTKGDMTVHHYAKAPKKKPRDAP